MKKILAFLLLLPFFVACSSDDDDSSDNQYAKEIIGTWKVTHLDSGKGYVEVPSSMTQTYATFKTDGTYSGRGYFGNGSGTYKVSGANINCYIEGELYLTYKVLSLSGVNAELEMSDGKTSVKLKCTKQ